MTPSITVTTQQQLDRALAEGAGIIIIRSPAGSRLTIRPDTQRDSSRVVAWDSSVVAWDSSRVEAWGSSHVVAWDSSRVVAWDSSHVVARGSSHVVAWDSSRVVARDSSRVEAWDSSHVEARDSSHVVARGSSHVEARGSSRVEAGPHVAVHRYSAAANVAGGVVIDVATLDLDDPRAWCEHHGVTIRDGHAVLYKAVDEHLTAGHDHRPTAYPIGQTVTADDWRDDHECGGGLHASPSPHQARSYAPGSPRYLRVSAPVDSIRPLDTDKCKAPAWLVESEVDLWREEIAPQAREVTP